MGACYSDKFMYWQDIEYPWITYLSPTQPGADRKGSVYISSQTYSCPNSKKHHQPIRLCIEKDNSAGVHKTREGHGTAMYWRREVLAALSHRLHLAYIWALTTVRASLECARKHSLLSLSGHKRRAGKYKTVVMQCTPSTNLESHVGA